MEIDSHHARSELRHLDALLARASQELDPHAFHYVHWGWIVLVWFPLANVCALLGHPRWQLPLGLLALACGGLLTWTGERRVARAPRVEREDRTFSRRIVIAVYGSIGAGSLLSALLPSLGLMDGQDVPLLWGLVYANIAFASGLLYRSDFLWAALFIFAGFVLALFLREHAGLVLGPFMGLGMIVPGRTAERALRAELGGGAGA